MNAASSSADAHSSKQDIITKFTNCRLVRGSQLVSEDLYVSSPTGTIIDGQDLLYNEKRRADVVIDVHNRIISPGLIDMQLNGGFGITFSEVPSTDGKEDVNKLPELLKEVNRRLIPTGVTSYLPTVTSQRSEVYHKLLPFSGPSGADRIPEHGSESLGAHIERPFLSSAKNGIRPLAVLQQTTNGISDLEACYGTSNLKNAALLTAAPERGILQCIPDIVNRGIVFSIGHTEASNEEAEEAVAAGATMITHPFNQMKPFHHRNPGIFGVLGSNGIKTTPPTTPGGKPKRSEYKLPFFSLIADGIHLHSTTVKIAYSVHPDGCILITDAMPIIGLPDGLYTYSPSSSQLIHKTGSKLTLQDSDVLAGSASTLMECVNNFLDWTGVGVAEALATVTEHPARVLGIEDRKGVLATGADADPVVFAEDVDGRRELLVEEVWKFGVKVWAKE